MMETTTVEERKENAQKVFNTVCSMLDNIKWSYVKQPADFPILLSENEYCLELNAVGKDMTIPLLVVVSADRQLLYVKSPLPFPVPANKRAEMSEALHIANLSILNGCFEYNSESGYVGFRAVTSIAGCEISERFCHYLLVGLTCHTVDRYNDKLYDVIKGRMTLKEFEQFANTTPWR